MHTVQECVVYGVWWSGFLLHIWGILKSGDWLYWLAVFVSFVCTYSTLQPHILTQHHISSRMLYNQFKASLIATNNIPAYVVLYHLVMFCLPLFLLPHFSSVCIVRILFLLSMSVITWVYPSFTDIFRCFFPFSRSPFWGISVFFHVPPYLNHINLFSPELSHLSIFFCPCTLFSPQSTFFFLL